MPAQRFVRVDGDRVKIPGWLVEDLLHAGLYVLLAQTLITALLAPMLCSLQLLLWRQLISGWR